MIETFFERTGEWTPREEMIRFIHELAAQSDLKIEDIGRTVLGQKIYSASLGNPNGSTMLAIANVHASEFGAREGLMKWCRDMALSTDPAVTNYLAEHQIYFVFTANMDGYLTRPYQYHTVYGTEMLITPFDPRLPESRAINRLVGRLEPAIIIDNHEWWPQTPNPNDLAYYARAVPSRPYKPEPLLLAQGEVIDTHIRARLEQENFVFQEYPTHGTKSMRAGAPALHAPVILSEPIQRRSSARRVEAAYALNQIVWEYHRDHHQALEAAKTESINAAVTGTSKLFIDDGAQFVEVPDPSFFDIPDGMQIPWEVFNAQGIDVTGRRVYTNQKSRGLIAPLLHPDSYLYIGQAGWRHSPSLPGAGKIGVVPHAIMQGGTRRPVTAEALQQSGWQGITKTLFDLGGHVSSYPGPTTYPSANLLPGVK